VTAGPDAGPGAPRSRTVPDAVFGPVTITDHAADGLVVVPGPGLPGVDLRRIGPVTERLVPIGSRRPGHVELRVDGHRHVLRPASGRLSRRSYHVHVELDGAPLLLAADRSHHRSVDPRPQPPRPRARHPRTRGRPPAARPVVPGRDTGSDRAEAAVGYAVATAFGTGARIMIAEVLAGVLGALS